MTKQETSTPIEANPPVVSSSLDKTDSAPELQFSLGEARFVGNLKMPNSTHVKVYGAYEFELEGRKCLILQNTQAQLSGLECFK